MPRRQRRAVAAQLHAREVRHPANGKTILTAGVAGNQHNLGMQFIADLFERDGWRAIQLGANVPGEDLAQAVDFFQADLVAISISLASQLPSLQEAIAAIRSGPRGNLVKILVGGSDIMGSAETAFSIGADGFAADAIEALAKARRLIGLPNQSFTN